jgi:hypothetical protein
MFKARMGVTQQQVQPVQQVQQVQHVQIAGLGCLHFPPGYCQHQGYTMYTKTMEILIGQHYGFHFAVTFSCDPH